MTTTTSKRFLVVCPASLVKNWEREAQKWLQLPGLAVTTQVLGAGELPNGSTITITNYDKVVGAGKNAKALREALFATQWDLVVFDEVHNLKNEKAQRTKFFLGEYDKSGCTAPGLVSRARFVLALTGTPVPNRTREMVPLLRALEAFGEFEGAVQKGIGGFLYRYCGPTSTYVGGREYKSFDGSTREPELQDRLRGGGWMVRRLKSQVLDELPPKLRSVIALPEVPALAELRELEAAILGRLTAAQQAQVTP